MSQGEDSGFGRIVQDIVPNLLSDIIQYFAGHFEGTILERPLKMLGFIRLSLEDQLRNVLEASAEQYFQAHPEFCVQGIADLFLIPGVKHHIHEFVRTGRIPDGSQLTLEINESLKHEWELHELVRLGTIKNLEQLVPGFLYCFQQCLAPYQTLGELLIRSDIDRAKTEILHHTDEQTQRILDLLQSWHPGGIVLRPGPPPFTAPPLPKYYVARPETLVPLRQLILSPGVSHQAVAIVGHGGLGGIGKSVLATALCHEPEIEARFPDGVIWLSLGHRTSANLLSELHQVGQALGDNIDFYSSLEVGQDRLSTLLREKAVLLILDDVWDYQHVQPFLVDSPRSRLLITTRNLAVATSTAKIATATVGILTETQALHLLANWAQQDYQTLPSCALDIVKWCGRLPLAIGLVGGRLVGKHLDQWEEVLVQLHHVDVADLQVAVPDDPYRSLLTALHLSVDELSPELRARYLDLVVFREDELIPEAVLKMWWSSEGLSELEVENTLNALASRSLVRLDAGRHVSVHDLVNDYIHLTIEDDSAYHERLLRAYAAMCPVGWATGPDDGYFFEHLTFHLSRAGQSSELHELLLASPDWWKAKHALQGHDAGFVDDLQTAMSIFTEPISIDDLGILIQLYAAREVILQSTRRVSDKILQTMVSLGRADEAIQLALLRDDAYARFNGVLAIQESLQRQKKPAVPYENVLEIARTIEVVTQRINAFVSIIEFYGDELDDPKKEALFTEAQRTLDDEPTPYGRAACAIPITRAMMAEDHADQATLLIKGLLTESAVLSSIGTSMLANILCVMRELDFPKHETERVLSLIRTRAAEEQPDALSSTASILGKCGFEADALETIGLIEDKYWRVVAFGNLAGEFHRLRLEDKANQFFKAASSTLGGMSDEVQASASYMLVEALGRAERYFAARELAYGIRYAYWRSLAIGALVSNLATAGRIPDALQCYPDLSALPSLFHYQATEDLALYLSINGFREDAARLLDTRSYIAAIDDTGLELGNKLGLVIDSLVGQGSLEQACRLAEEIPDTGRRMQRFVQIALAYYVKRNIDECRKRLEYAGSLRPSSQVGTDAYGLIPGLAQSALVWLALSDASKATNMFETALDLAKNLPSERGRCWALGAVVRVGILAGSVLPQLKSRALTIMRTEASCLDEIALEVASVLNLGADAQLARELIDQVYADSSYESGAILVRFFERAIEENHDSLQSIILTRLETLSGRSSANRSMFIRSYVESLILIRDFDLALEMTDVLDHPETRAAAKLRVATALLKCGQEKRARELYEHARTLAATVETYGEWQAALYSWTAALVEKGYLLEATKVYKPDRLQGGYCWIVEHWGEELNSLSNGFGEQLLRRIIRIQAWTDHDWQLVVQILEGVAG